jgi:hypothetical protein
MPGWHARHRLPFLAEFLLLNRREAVLCRKMRNSAFCYYEPLSPPYVTWCYGLNWHALSCLEEDEKLPLRYVQRLLEVLLERKPHFPTRRQIIDLHMDAERCKGWARVFPHKRRQLVWLFRTAVRLEEDVVCGI